MVDPTALDTAEEPLLINPYLDDPNTYLVFDELGHVHARDGNVKGQTTIDVLDLNRSELVDIRRMLINNSNAAISKAVVARLDEGKQLNASLDHLINQKAFFSQAIRSYIKFKLAKLSSELKTDQL